MPSLTIDSENIWRPARQNESVYKYFVEYARSGVSKCRKCGELIAKASVRIAVPVRARSGEYGWISAWQHVSCTRFTDEEIGQETKLLPSQKRVKYLMDLISIYIYNFCAISKDEQYELLEKVSDPHIPEHLKPLNPDDLIKHGILEQAVAPPALRQQLLPFQKEGLNWMIKQESSKYNGGILADEMGMGKTIQIISLMLKNKGFGPTLVVCPVSSMAQWKEEVEKNVMPDTLDVLCVTKSSNWSQESIEVADIVLTTYPIVELAWRKMINARKVSCKYCEKLFLPMKLAIHNKYFCGPTAQKTLKQTKQEKGPISVEDYKSNTLSDKSFNKKQKKLQSTATIKKGLRSLHIDIDDDQSKHMPVNITGPIAMYRELMEEAGRKVRGRFEKKWKEDTEDEETDNLNESEDSELESEAFEEEMKNAVERLNKEFLCKECGFKKLRYKFCPKNGSKHKIADEREIDLLLNMDQPDVTQSIIHNIKWYRIVLDEAHRIKGRNTSTARSVYALQSIKKWCLTGTPLQNRVGDLYSLLRFLNVNPYAKYFCKAEGCCCECSTYPFSKYSIRECVLCGHSSLQHYNYFNRFIMNPIIRHGYVGFGKSALILLTNDILHNLMLRRTKIERKQEMNIGQLEVKIHYVNLTPQERDIYEALYKRSAAKFDSFVKKNTVLHNYAHIFELLSRLRQALDHPYLVTRKFSKDIVTSSRDKPAHICSICNDSVDPKKAAVVDPCKHAYHPSCLLQYIDSAPVSKNFNQKNKNDMSCLENVLVCPQCFVPISVSVQRLLEIIQFEQETGEFEEQGTYSPLGTEKLQDILFDSNNENYVSYNEENISTLPPWINDQATDIADTSVKQKRKTGKPLGIMAELDTSKFIVNSKIKAMLEYVYNVPIDEKIIIFSQFGAMLDLIEYCFNKANMTSRTPIHPVKLTGSMPMSVRLAVLRAFHDDDNVRCILIGLKAGGEGLNLQNANHVLLSDPWWNPAVEMQAVQRAHRIGQKKEVHAVRFVTKNSVEERMIELQHKKMLVFEGTVDSSTTALSQLSEEDIGFLFTL